MNRAYSILDVKSVKETADEWVIEGIASTPTPDRMRDIVEPMGAKFRLPMPLLWQHDASKPVGRVEFARPTKSGIPYVAHLPKIQEAGTLKDRVDEAAHSIKHRLVTAVSIGFSAVEGAVEALKNGGLRFKEWEWLELSLVTIPANAEATITSIKSIDEQHLAASGRSGAPPRDRNHPGASGTTKQAASSGFFHSRSRKGDTMNLKDLREQRSTKNARMQELLELFKAVDHETSDEESAEYDELLAEVKQLDTEIRVAQYHAMNATSGKSVDGGSSSSGTASRGGMGFVKKTDPDDKFKGQSVTRLAIAKAGAFVAMKQGNYMTPGEFAERRWGKTHPNLVRYIKAAVAGGGTDTGEWGAELAQSDTRYNGDFIEYLYGMTLFDSLPLREVPANIHIKGADGAATAFWVGQSKAIPVTAPSASDVELRALKVGAIAVCSKELVADSSPSAEQFIRDSIGEASAQRIDTTFFSANAAVSGVSPAGILNGVSAIASAGSTAADLRDDIASLMAPFITAKNARGLVFVTNPSLATAMSLMVNALGQVEFAGIAETGGELWKRRLFVGDNVGTGDLILMNPRDIWKIGDSGLEFSMSDSAMVEQDSAPTGATDTPVAASATMVSLWQEDSIGFKVTRRINWGKRRPSAVAYVGDAAYGTGT